MPLFAGGFQADCMYVDPNHLKHILKLLRCNGECGVEETG